MDIYLETEHIILREFLPEDENNLLDLDSDPDVMQYLTRGSSSTREDIIAAMAKTNILQLKHAGKFGFWAAIEKESNKFMGWFHFRPSNSEPNNTKEIEIGYRLKKKFWGKGYATEGSMALILKGFTAQNVEKVFAEAMSDNLASRRVMVKMGLNFSKEFNHERYPEIQDKVVRYSLVKSEYKKQLNVTK